MSPADAPSRALPTLRSQFSLWLGGLALAILALVGGYLGKLAADELFAAQQAAVRATAQAAAELLSLQLRDRERQVELLSVAPHLVDGPLDSPRVRESLERRQALHDEFAWLGVVAPDGTVLQATGGMLTGRSVAQRDWFIAARERVFVGDVHEAKLLATMLPAVPDGEPTRFIDFAAPIRDAEGRLLGVVGAHAHWRWVTGLVEGVVRRQLPGGGIDALILDRQGRVLYAEALKVAQQGGVAVLPQPVNGRFGGSWCSTASPTWPARRRCRPGPAPSWAGASSRASPWRRRCGRCRRCGATWSCCAC
ncbi:MAG: cache domain-containing protein [Roseateles sp.]